MAVLNRSQLNERGINDGTVVDYTESSIEYAELYSIILSELNDLEINFTNWDSDIDYGGLDWLAVPIDRKAIKYHSSLQVDELEVSVGVVGVAVGSKEYSMPEVIRHGFLNNAEVSVYRIIPNASEYGHSLIFTGNIRKKMGFKDGSLTFSITHILDDLKKKFPCKYYQEQCNHKLFDTYCTLSKGTYVNCFSITATSDKDQIVCSDVNTFDDQWFQHGLIEFTSGDNQHITRSIEFHKDETIYLYQPLPENPQTGDNFHIYPGCDKTGTMCHSKFNNYVNFFGFEHIPTKEVMYGF